MLSYRVPCIFRARARLTLSCRKSTSSPCALNNVINRLGAGQHSLHKNQRSACPTVSKRFIKAEEPHLFTMLALWTLSGLFNSFYLMQILILHNTPESFQHSLAKRFGEQEMQRRNECQDSSIVEIISNTSKSPKVRKIFALIRTLEWTSSQ